MDLVSVPDNLAHSRAEDWSPVNCTDDWWTLQNVFLCTTCICHQQYYWNEYHSSSPDQSMEPCFLIYAVLYPNLQLCYWHHAWQRHLSRSLSHVVCNLKLAKGQTSRFQWQPKPDRNIQNTWLQLLRDALQICIVCIVLVSYYYYYYSTQHWSNSDHVYSLAPILLPAWLLQVVPKLSYMLTAGLTVV